MGGFGGASVYAWAFFRWFFWHRVNIFGLIIIGLTMRSGSVVGFDGCCSGWRGSNFDNGNILIGAIV